MRDRQRFLQLRSPSGDNWTGWDRRRPANDPEHFSAEVVEQRGC
jgi:hypothetical protein